MDLQNLELEQIKEICSELELKFIELYLQKKTIKEICDTLKLRRPQYCYITQKYKLSRFRTNTKYDLNPNNLNRDNVKIWYFLGMFASDGNLYHKNGDGGSTTVQFTLKDRDPLDDIVNILEYNGPILEYDKKNVGHVYYLSICNPHLENFLEEIFGDCVRKTKTLAFPKIKTKKQAEMFLRGYFDGDGCYTPDGRYPQWYNVEWYCDSEEFLNGLCKLIEKMIGIKTEPKRKRFRLSAHKKVYDFCKFVYKNNLDIGLKRKQTKALSHIKEWEAMI